MSIKKITTGLLASSLALPMALVSVPVSGVDAIAIPNPFASPEEAMAKLQARQSNIVRVTGVCSAGLNGRARPSRQEIRSVLGDKDYMDLYLLALDGIMKDGTSNPTSHWQMSAIHGAPYERWAGDNGNPTGNSNSGYCTHASILFPTWHRPYLALYEQSLWNKMKSIVNAMPSGSTKDRLNKRMPSWRMPYWDWAVTASMPDIIGKTQQVDVPTGQGTATRRINNPLYSYKFPKGAVTSSSFPASPYSTWKSQTLRYPTNNNADASSQPDQVNSQLTSNQASFRSRVYQLITQQTNYQHFSNKAWSSSGGSDGQDSLESVHDSIHGLVGNGGHMSAVDYAAFDPIFYLHHTNIDRIAAIWQALHPGSFVVNQKSPWGNWVTAPGNTETVTTSLGPFRKSDGNYYNSNDARSIYSFCYSYPELSYWKYKQTSDFQSSVRQKVNGLYGSTTKTLSNAVNSKKKREEPVVFPVNNTRQALIASVKQDTYEDWKVDIRSNRLALNGTYFVNIFLGQAGPDPKLWAADPNLVGSHVVFANAMINDCPLGGCTPEDNIVSGSIPLTPKLISRIVDIGSLNANDTLPYLVKNLHWKVQMANDTAVNTTSVPSLQISVASAEVTLPKTSDDFPVYAPYITYRFVTEERAGGLNSTQPV